MRDSLPEDNPVDDKAYQVPLRFTGKIIKLTVKLGPEKLSASEQRKVSKIFQDKRGSDNHFVTY